MINEMRRIPAADEKISNVDGGSLWDCRLPSSLERFGPFENTQEFHTFLRNSLEKTPPGHPDVDEMISLQRREWGPPVFTHGDLSSLNILVRGDRIVGLVDWETAGWYPPYWEYTSACQVNPRNTFWESYIDRFLEPWPEAAKMEKTRQKWWGWI
jgi:aminoglycoside phosphotransferase (APT) family kinase protein